MPAYSIEDEQLIDNCYDLIIKLMYEGGKLVIDGFHKATKNIETKSGSWDLVTEYDKLVEELLINGILAKYPNHKFIAEETASENDLSSDPTWVIDPIDGTNNFVHGFPLICMSLALAINKEIVIGIVYNPILNEVYTSRKGKGAFLNGKQIYCSKVDKLDDAIYTHEGTFVRVERVREKNIKRMYNFASRAQGFRSLGTAALTLAYVARGCLDGYIIDDLYPWDVAAGALLIQEAGGSVYRTDGKPFHFMEPKLVCASTEILCKEMILNLKEADSMNMSFK